MYRLSKRSISMVGRSHEFESWLRTRQSRGSLEACSCASGTWKRSITQWNAPIVEKRKEEGQPALPFSLSPPLAVLFKRENARPRSSFNLFEVYTSELEKSARLVDKMTKEEIILCWRSILIDDAWEWNEIWNSWTSFYSLFSFTDSSVSSIDGKLETPSKRRI